MAKFVQLTDAKTGEPIYPITGSYSELSEEDIEAICDFDEGMSEEDVIPKATNSALGCVVVGDGLDVSNGVLSNGWRWELIWTNASPTSDFAPQTINLDLSEYSLVMALCRYTAADSRLTSTIGVVGTPIAMSMVYGTSGKIQGLYRLIHLNKTNITVDAGWITTPSQDTSGNNVMIPHYIYGIKGVS